MGARAQPRGRQGESEEGRGDCEEEAAECWLGATRGEPGKQVTNQPYLPGTERVLRTWDFQ